MDGAHDPQKGKLCHTVPRAFTKCAPPTDFDGVVCLLYPSVPAPARVSRVQRSCGVVSAVAVVFASFFLLPI